MASLVSRMATILILTSLLSSMFFAHAEPMDRSTINMIEVREFTSAERHVSDKVHGVIMALTVTLILPVGALTWRLFPSVGSKTLLRMHLCFQVLGLAMLLTGFGCGVWNAFTHDEV